MKYSLINPVNKEYSAIEQILTNRGIARKDIPHYLNTSDEDIASFTTFGLDILKKAATSIIQAVSFERDAVIIVDADCDGFTSSAVLYNYLYDAFPSWAAAHLRFILHNGKQHGLDDHIDILKKEIIAQDKIMLILIPDAGSNDTEQCKELNNLGCPVIILDHHICDKENPYAYIINNQNSDYPNKELSGVGVTWQFCRYLDSLLSTHYADKYLDLVALGNCADMMSMTSLETKHLIQSGLKDENLCNPFIVSMIERNRYSIGENVTPIGIAFYVAPLVNAIVRSGTEEEKQLVFESMLTSMAFTKILSNKRGHKAGELETIVEQAVRTAVNVKARQTKAQDNGMDLLEGLIAARRLLDHKVLLFLLEPGQIDKNIAGLVANKLMAKYQRPCCVLTRIGETDENIPPWEETQELGPISYQGSARGCDKVGITQFKDICEATGVIMYATGHQGAFGLGILEENIQTFIDKTDAALADMPDEPVYYVDYIWNENEIKPEAILDIADLAPLWGKDLDEALIAIKHLRVTQNMVTIYDKKGYTIKITLPNGLACIKFRSSEEEY